MSKEPLLKDYQTVSMWQNAYNRWERRYIKELEALVKRYEELYGVLEDVQEGNV